MDFGWHKSGAKIPMQNDRDGSVEVQAKTFYYMAFDPPFLAVTFELNLHGGKNLREHQHVDRLMDTTQAPIWDLKFSTMKIPLGLNQQKGKKRRRVRREEERIEFCREEAGLSLNHPLSAKRAPTC